MMLGVGYMHRNLVIHRDLKPGNFLISEDGKIKVADLGLAKKLRYTEDNAKTWCGTPKYLSPEILKNDGYNRKSDIFSLGDIFYKLMTLTHPFLFKGVAWEYIKNKEIKEISGNYSQELKEVILKMLEKDSSKRPDITDILQMDYFIEKSKNIGLYKDLADFLLLPIEGDTKSKIEIKQAYEYLVKTLNIPKEYFIYDPIKKLMKKQSLNELTTEEMMPYLRWNGWYAFSLNTKKIYPDFYDNEWITEKNSWKIAYHGLRNTGIFTIGQKIKLILENGLKEGPTQFCEGEEDLMHPGQKVGRGVYHYEDISEMVYKAGTTADDEGYLFGFQCKVKYESIMQSKEKPVYWVVPGTKECTRPYRLLFRKVTYV